MSFTYVNPLVPSSVQLRTCRVRTVETVRNEPPDESIHGCCWSTATFHSERSRWVQDLQSCEPVKVCQPREKLMPLESINRKAEGDEMTMDTPRSHDPVQMAAVYPTLSPPYIQPPLARLSRPTQCPCAYPPHREKPSVSIPHSLPVRTRKKVKDIRSMTAHTAKSSTKSTQTKPPKLLLYMSMLVETRAPGTC